MFDDVVQELRGVDRRIGQQVASCRREALVESRKIEVEKLAELRGGLSLPARLEQRVGIRRGGGDEGHKLSEQTSGVRAVLDLKPIAVIQRFRSRSIVDGGANPRHPMVDALADKMLDRSHGAVFELEGAAEPRNHVLIEADFVDLFAGRGELVG